jgi:hypothetical protein
MLIPDPVICPRKGAPDWRVTIAEPLVTEQEPERTGDAAASLQIAIAVVRASCEESNGSAIGITS